MGSRGQVRALADVIADGGRLILVTVVHQIGERLAAASHDPVLLERRAILEGGSQVREPDRVWSEQPLVAGADQRVGLDMADIERQRADRLRPVDHQERVAFPGALAYVHEVEQRAVGPVDLRQGDDRRPMVDGREQARAPRDRPGAFGRRRRLDHLQLEPTLGAQTAPRVDVARKLLLDDDDVVAPLDGCVARDRGQPIRDRRDDRDAVGVGDVHEPGEETPYQVALLEEVGGADQVRGRPTVDAGNTRRAHGVGQRRHERAVQVVRPVGQGEPRFLARKHGWSIDAAVYVAAPRNPHYISLTQVTRM